MTRHNSQLSAKSVSRRELDSPAALEPAKSGLRTCTLLPFLLLSPCWLAQTRFRVRIFVARTSSARPGERKRPVTRHPQLPKKLTDAKLGIAMEPSPHLPKYSASKAMEFTALIHAHVSESLMAPSISSRVGPVSKSSVSARAVAAEHVH